MMQPRILTTMILLFCLLAVTSGFTSSTPLERIQRGGSSLLAFTTPPTTSTKVDVTELAPRNGQGFLDWANYYGIRQENFQIDPEGDNWGAIAVRDAPQGSRVLMVPSTLHLTTMRIRQEDDFANFEPIIAQRIAPSMTHGEIALANHFYLFLKVLKEYELGTNSPYFPWLDALPRKFSTAIHFTPQELDCLPPFVRALSQRDQANYQLFVQTLQSLSIPSISDSTKATTELTQWAFDVVFTRARASVETKEAEIIPMSDMLNHDSTPNVEVQYDNEGTAHLVLLRDVRAGDKLYKSYGHPTNPSRFLATYGFHDMSPPATYCKLFPEFVDGPVPQELIDLGFDYTTMVFFPQTGGIAEPVWDVMLYSILGEMQEFNSQAQFHRAHVQGDTQTKQEIHNRYRTTTCQALLRHVETMLQELQRCKEGLDDDAMITSNMPMIAGHNEFVRLTFCKVQKTLQDLLRQET